MATQPQVESDMQQHEALPEPATGSQFTAPNLSVEVNGDTFVYRRYGNTKRATPPLLCLQHFRGNLDQWDPASCDRIAQDREIILLANRGVGRSTGQVPDTVAAMARDTIAFVSALGLKSVDLLGYSLGGYIAQEMALLQPRLVRRIVLAATAPRSGPRIHRWSDKVYSLAAADVPGWRTSSVSSSPARRRAARREWHTLGASALGKRSPTSRPTWQPETLSSPRSPSGESRTSRG